MIWSLLLLTVSFPVGSIGLPYPQGNGRISSETELSRLFIRNLGNLRNVLRHVNVVHGQESSSSNVFRKESISRGYDRKFPPSPKYLKWINSSSLANHRDKETSRVKSQDLPSKSSVRRFKPGSKHVLHKDTGSSPQPFEAPNNGMDKLQTSAAKLNRELIVKVGNHEIRIRPEDYEVQRSKESENVAKFEDQDTQSKHFISTDEYIVTYPSASLRKNYSVVSPVSSGYSVAPFSSEQFYPASSVSSNGGAYSLTSPVENVHPHSEVSSGPMYGPLEQPRETISANDFNRKVEKVSWEQTAHEQNDTNDNLWKYLEAEREVIINGQPQRNRTGKDRTPEFPHLISEDKFASVKDFPPLLIEEIEFSHVNHVEFPNGSDSVLRELPPKRSQIDVTERKLKVRPIEETPTEMLGTTEAEVSHRSESDFLNRLLNSSDGSGDVTESRGFEALDILNIEDDNELISDRKLTADVRQSLFLEEGSGLQSLEDQRDRTPTRNISPRIIDIFARPNDSSTPCTTPKGEPGHCRDIRYCLLQEVLNNFNIYLQYVCLIRRRFVGVCCPDNPVISQTTEPDEGNVESAMAGLEEFRQPQKGCGVNVKTRIVGGTISQPHEWTWMVALLRKNRFFCGGVLLNNWYVLTAAHCTLGVKPRDLKVRLGEYNFLEFREHQKDIGVQEIKRHAQFITLTFQHDIALLKLKRSVEFSRFVGTICLPEVNRTHKDVNATVVGWGTISFGGAASPVLREVTLPVWRNADCDRTYLFESINDSFICAGSPEPNQDACQGDSGGPLMAMNEDERWEAIGIVSWGRRCGDPRYPGVYTRIATYLDWIQKNLN